MQVIREDVMRHTRHHCCIGVGPDRYPPGIVSRGRIRVLGINQHKFTAALFRHAHVHEGVTTVEGIGWIPPPHDHQF